MYDFILFYNIVIGILFLKCYKIKKNVLIFNLLNSLVICVIFVYIIFYSNYLFYFFVLFFDVFFF